jgi:hypothetical protein
MDTHAETIVFGRNAVVLQYTSRECNVAPFTDVYKLIKHIPIVTGALAWTLQVTGDTYILVLNEGLWMLDKMEAMLVNPNQLRHYGVMVQDNPFSESPLFIMSNDETFIMNLEADGTNIFADTHQPTQRELEECPHIVLPSPHPWDPLNVQFPESKRSMEEEMRMHNVSAVHRTWDNGETFDEHTWILYNPAEVHA